MLVNSGTRCPLLEWASTFSSVHNEPYVDLTRRPQTQYGRVRGFRGWRPLTFIWAIFVSFICFLVFSKDFCSSAIGSFCSFRLPNDLIEIYQQQRVLDLVLESTTWGSTWPLARCEIRSTWSKISLEKWTWDEEMSLSTNILAANCLRWFMARHTMSRACACAHTPYTHTHTDFGWHHTLRQT